MEHTKGPWTIEKEDGEFWAIYSGSELVADVLHKYASFTMAEGEANARLIAAAPDLLAMCRLAAKYVAKMVADDVKTALPPIVALNRIEAAIKQAEGKEI